jgi:hypothetical protein
VHLPHPWLMTPAEAPPAPGKGPHQRCHSLHHQNGHHCELQLPHCRRVGPGRRTCDEPLVGDKSGLTATPVPQACSFCARPAQLSPSFLPSPPLHKLVQLVHILELGVAVEKEGGVVSTGQTLRVSRCHTPCHTAAAEQLATHRCPCVHVCHRCVTPSYPCDCQYPPLPPSLPLSPGHAAAPGRR